MDANGTDDWHLHPFSPNKYPAYPVYQQLLYRMPHQLRYLGIYVPLEERVCVLVFACGLLRCSWQLYLLPN